MEQVGVGAGGYQATHQRVFKHVAGAAGVLADDDSGGAVVAFAPVQLGVVPAQETAYLVGVVSGEGAVGFPTEAVGSKIFAHKKDSFTNSVYFFPTTTPPVFQMLFAGTTPRTQEVG